MKELSLNECKKIIGGGTSISGTLINAFKSCVNVFFEMGQYIGGAIRRITSNHLCEM